MSMKICIANTKNALQWIFHPSKIPVFSFFICCQKQVHKIKWGKPHNLSFFAAKSEQKITDNVLLLS